MLYSLNREVVQFTCLKNVFLARLDFTSPVVFPFGTNFSFRFGEQLKSRLNIKIFAIFAFWISCTIDKEPKI